MVAGPILGKCLSELRLLPVVQREGETSGCSDGETEDRRFFPLQE
jgi:hypothetical protein